MMASRATIRISLLVALSLPVFVVLIALVAHFYPFSGRSEGTGEAADAFSRALADYDRDSPAALQLLEETDSRMQQKRERALERDIGHLLSRASSVRQHLSVLKRVRALGKAGVFRPSTVYRFACKARERLPWAEELCAVAAGTALESGDVIAALRHSRSLDPERYDALILASTSALSQEDTPAAWLALLAGREDRLEANRDPVALARLLARFFERKGFPESMEAWTLNAAWFALLDGRRFEALSIAEPLLYYETLPGPDSVRSIAELFTAAGDFDKALALAERSALRNDLLFLAELQWCAGHPEEALGLWRSVPIEHEYRAVYNRSLHDPQTGDRAALEAVLAGDSLSRAPKADWVSVRILLSRLAGEGEGSLRNARDALAATHGGDSDVRLELEALMRMDQGREGQAVLAGLWQLVNTRPGESLVWERAAWWMFRYQHGDELSLLLKRAEEAGMRFKNIVYYEALAAIGRGDYEGARALYDSLAGADGSWRALANRALIARALRDPRKALEDLSLASSLFMDGERNGRAVAPGSWGRIDEAGIEEYVGLLVRLARLQEDLGESGEARRTLLWARDLDPGNLKLRRDIERLDIKKAPR